MPFEANYGHNPNANYTPEDWPMSQSAATRANIDKYGYTEHGLAYLSNNADSYLNAYNQEKAWLREDLIRKEGYEREDTAYTRMFDELKRLGVNPALLLSSASPMIGQSNSYNSASFKSSNYEENEKTQAANSAKVFGAIIAALALVAAAAL